MPGGRRIVIEFVGQDNAGKAVGKVIGQLESVKNRLQALNRASADPQVDADTVAAVNKIDDLKARLEFLRKQTPTVDVVADINDAMLQLEEVNAAAKDLDGRRVNINVDADTAAAISKFDRLKVKMLEVGGGGDLKSLLGTLGNVPLVGALLQNPVTALATVATGAAILAKVTRAAFGTGAALGAVAMGVGAVKLALSNLKLTKAGREFDKFKDHIKAAKTELQKTAQRNILPGLQRGIQGLAKQAGPFKAAWQSVTRSIGRNLGKLGEDLGKNKSVTQFLDNIKKDAPGVFASLRTSVENVVTSLTNLFNAFDGGGGKGKKGHKSLTQTIQDVTGKLKDFTSNPEKMDHLVQNVNDLADGFNDVWDKASKVYHVLSTPVPAPKQAVVPKIAHRFAQDFKNIPKVAAQTWNHVKSITSRAWHAITGFVMRGVHGVNSDVAHGWHAVTSTTSHAWAAIRNAVSRAWGAIRGAASRGAASVSNVASRAWGAIRGAAARAWSAIVSTISRAWSRVVSAVSSGASRVVSLAQALPGRILGALGNLGGLLVAAGRSVMSGLLSGISSGASAVYAKVRSVASGIASAAMGALKSHSPSLVFIRIGHSIMDGLIVGMEHRRIRLGRALNRILADVKRHGEKLKSLLSAKQGVISVFRGMPGSVFSQDLNVTTTSANGVERTRRATAHSMVAFQQGQAHQAQRLARDIRKLRREGISDNLLRQMVDAGEAGWANIHTLAQGSRGQVHALNRANAATQAALTRAGRGVGTELYQPRIHEQRTDIRVAKHLEHALERVLKHHDKRIVIELHVDGRHLHTALLRHKRKRGRSLRLG